MFSVVGEVHSDDLLKLDDEVDGETVQENGYEDCNDTQGENGETNKFEDWSLLDMHFGLPLFDAKLNKEICEKVLFLICLFIYLYSK